MRHAAKMVLSWVLGILACILWLGLLGMEWLVVRGQRRLEEVGEVVATWLGGKS